MSGHQPAAVFHERLQLRALRIAQVGDIGQRQNLELPQVLRVQLAVRNHFERDAAFHQGMIEPGGVVGHGPRRRHQSDTRERPLIAQIALRSSSARRKGPPPV